MSKVKDPDGLLSLREEDLPERAPAGLVDGGQLTIRCSNCRAQLLRVWSTTPDEPCAFDLVATCPFCGDRSFPVTVKGGFFPGGCGTPREGDPTDEVPSTTIDTYGPEDGVMLFHMIKGSRDAKPLRD